MPRRIARLSVALIAAATATVSATAAAQAQAPSSIAVPTAEGYSLQVTFTPEAGYNPELAASYVAYLDSIPHGTELRKLKIQIATPAQVAALCGAREDEGVLGCYGGGDSKMIVPSSGLDGVAADGQYTVRYVLTHEYGHHIAAYRSNSIYGRPALDWGPKFWASYTMVCNQAIDNKLFPGDEGDRYLSNPGEAWAEVYARLVFPEQPWRWTELLTPDAVALDAARRDVLTPWRKNVSTTFTMAAGRNRQAFAVPLTLDGRLSATVTGPKGSEVSVAVTSGNQKVGASKRKGARDSWSLSSGCRETPTETLTFTATRKGGASGPVTLKVSYPG